MSDVVATRVPKDVKEQMETLVDVNWSEVIREAILRRIREEQLKRAREIEDKIRSRTAGTSHIVLARGIREERNAH